MNNCLIKNSEYRTKLALSGIPELAFYSFVNSFTKKYGRYPNLDEIPCANSKPYVETLLHMEDKSSAKIDDILLTTQTNNTEEALIVLNDLYRDLEVDIFPLNTEAIVHINNKPSEFLERMIEPTNISETVNLGLLFNQMFDKLRRLYGIELIPITNKELSSSKWQSLPEVKIASAFVYNNKIYINTDNADIDAPIHEMTHILLGSIRFKSPDLYYQLVEMAQKFPNFNKLLRNNPNKAFSDACEEVFVLEMAKYLSGRKSEIDSLENSVKYELHYNIKRLLDAVLMGKYSVKSIDADLLYNLSLKELVKIVESDIMQASTLSSLDDATLHRMLNNKKTKLIREGYLKEEC